jgi:DNA polymerase-3 subunit beta
VKLTIDRDPLLKAVARATGVVARGNVHAILGNVRLDADAGGTLSITATDLDAEIVVGVAAEVQEAGSSTVPATRLHDLLRNLPAGGQVVLEHPSREPHAKLACGRTRVSLPTLPPGDFPLMTAEGAAAGGPIAPAALARLFETTRHAISGEATRYYLCGAYLHVVEVGGERLLRVVATDGARLALAEIPAPDGFETLPPVIVPTKAVDEITKLLAGEADAELRTSAAKVVLDVGSNRLVSKVLDGSYPEYARVIPRDNPRRLRVDVGALASALKRAAVLADDKSRSIRFSISPGQLALSARSDDSGSLREEVEADYDGEAFDVGFNGRMVGEMLARISGESVELQLADPASPTLALDPIDSRVRFVLMPLRV